MHDIKPTADKKSTSFVGHFDDHDDALVQCQEHRPIQQVY
jgi:hypothetical protein